MAPGHETPEEETSTPVQEARAKLRKGFLRGITELNGEQCKILTYEHSLLQATFSGWNPSSSEVLVRDLETPANVTMASAVLRTPDILAVQFDRPIQLP